MITRKLCVDILQFASPICSRRLGGLLGVSPSSVQFVAALRTLNLPPDYSDVEYPPERRKLKFLEKQPPPPVGQRLPKMTKAISEMRGPELVHNKLIHKQYGIRANQGGRMKYGHFEMIRLAINRKIDEKKTFAVWRIDSPWKSVTKKGQGHRMGGGKGSIDHYVTPIKADRIIVEVGGHIDWQEIYPLLRLVAHQLPFKAEPVSQEFLEAESRELEQLEQQNQNPFTWEYAAQSNMRGCHAWLSPYDYQWHGKYR